MLNFKLNRVEKKVDDLATLMRSVLSAVSPADASEAVEDFLPEPAKSLADIKAVNSKSVLDKEFRRQMVCSLFFFYL